MVTCQCLIRAAEAEVWRLVHVSVPKLLSESGSKGVVGAVVHSRMF